tara:strand:- start:142 stop:582 length:441 start_codon:yes stop_codon:yes gene_type:complete
MIEYILIIFFIVFVLISENKLKFYHIQIAYQNYGLIKFIIKNLLYAIPLLTLYFNYDSIITKMKTNQTMKTQNTNNNTSRSVSQTVKKYVASNQQWKCNYCKNLLDASYEVDHITPLYKNGSNDISNLQALCRNCHGKKTIYDRFN